MRIRNRGPKLYDSELMVAEYRKILDACELTIGPWNERLEREFAALTGVRYAVTCSSGGDAFMMILAALKYRRRGRRVFIPTNTHLATVGPAMMLGMAINLVDVNHDMLVDLSKVVPALQRNDILCIVATGGWLPEDLKDHMEEIGRRGATVVIDAAHAHGAVYCGKPVGSWGIAASFSFYASKLVCGGEGGIIASDDRELTREVMRLRDCGKVCQTYDEFVSVGMSSRLSNILAMQAAIQLRHLSDIIEERQRWARMYQEVVGEHARFIRPAHHDLPNWYKYTIVLSSRSEAEELDSYMLANGIEMSSKTFPVPLHRQPVVRQYLDAHPECPVADEVCASHLCLPGYIGIAQDEVELVCAKLRAFWA